MNVVVSGSFPLKETGIGICRFIERLGGSK